MKTILAFRSRILVLSVSLLAFLLSSDATGQSLVAGSPELTPRVLERLSTLADDPKLLPWQREFTQGLVHESGPTPSDSESTQALTPLAAGASIDVEGTWEEMVIHERAGASAIFDPVRRRMIVFGGYDFSGYRNDVWALSLAETPAWTAIDPIGQKPNSRAYHTAIYDPVRDRMVVFGGYYVDYLSGADHYLSDVWSLSLAGTPAWTTWTPGGAPPTPRAWHSAIYDPVRDQVLVFGGSDGALSERNDVWALALAGTMAWAPVLPGGTLPAARDGASAIYDPVRDRMVLFGGFDASPHELRNDVWALSLAGTPAWVALAPAGTLPPIRAYHTAIYDPIRDRMVVFGGFNRQYFNFLSDVWALSFSDSLEWTPLTPARGAPRGRYYHNAIFDPGSDRMIVAAGYEGSYDNDAWALSMSGLPAWTEMTSPGETSANRAFHTAILNPVSNRMVAFAGYADYQLPMEDVVELSLVGAPIWTGPGWPVVRPSRRYGHSAIYDPPRNRMLVFGGFDDVGARNDVWAFSLSGTPSWSLLAPTGTAPSVRFFHSAIYDPLRDRMIVFGGSTPYYGANLDVWVLSLAGTPSWTELMPTGALPTHRYGHSAIYDPVRDRMVVFGGVGFRDVWAMSLGDAPEWSELTPAGPAPLGRTFHSSIYDPGRDRMVVFGGYDGAGARNDAWALSLANSPAWRLLTISGTPPATRYGHSAIYDPARDRMVVFSGYHGGILKEYLQDSWALSFMGAPTPTLASLVDARGFLDRVELTWQLSARSVGGTRVYRREAASAWLVLGTVTTDGLDRIRWTDSGVTPGTRYGYRLGFAEDSTETFAGETWVDVPVAPALALEGARPNPSAGRLSASFTLTLSQSATLELLDVAGRKLRSRQVGSLGAGHHVLDMTPDHRLVAGVYLLRLTQGVHVLTSKVAVVK